MNEILLDDRYKYVFDSQEERYHIHIDGEPCPLRPKSLYKFYAANLNNIASLHEAYFWLSKPSEFNDPYDCNLNLVEYEDEILNEDSVPNAIEDVGITCFSESIEELLMWAHYTNNYRGYAIAFNPESLRVKMNLQRKYSLNPTLYLKQFPKVRNTEGFAMEYLLTAKHHRWEYEKEWRFLSSINTKEKYNRIIFYDPIAVKALYIGHRLLDEQESVFNLIESIFITKYPDKPIYIVYPNPKKLDMVFLKRYN